MNDSPAVLIVDDDPDNRRIAGAILKSAGWRVDDVEDGATAIDAVRAGDYALVLLDIQMPGLDGFETAMALRDLGGDVGVVPIMAFTALRRQEALDRARAAGMDGYVAKPFTPEGLLQAVRPWWPEPAAPHAVRLAAIFGEAEIAGLLGRFRAQLLDVLASGSADGNLRGRAHKLAGIAGTLGFAEISRHWLSVSEGDDSAIDAARAATRKALLGLGRYRGEVDEG